MDPKALSLSCILCKKPLTPSRYQPFCSARCQQVDLGRWFQETYTIPTEEKPDTEEISKEKSSTQ